MFIIYDMESYLTPDISQGAHKGFGAMDEKHYHSGGDKSLLCQICD